MSPMLLATFAAALATALAVVFACRELFALRAARGFSAELEANETEKILALKAASKARFGALSELMRPRTSRTCDAASSARGCEPTRRSISTASPARSA